MNYLFRLKLFYLLRIYFKKLRKINVLSNNDSVELNKLNNYLMCYNVNGNLNFIGESKFFRCVDKNEANIELNN